MTGLRRALGLVAIEGIVVGLVALAIMLSSEHVENRGATAAIGLFLGWSFIGAGLFAWWRRPDNRFGVLMTAVGFAFFLGSLTAADGASALQECCRLKPQVVLLDVQLPDIDGFDVCQQITKHNGAPDVIMTSSRDSSDFGPLVSTSGACGFVPKAELSGERVQELLSL